MAAAVKETPFFLVSRAPAQTVLGGLEPGRLLAGMGILALVIIGGGLAMVSTMTRTLKLQTMLDASRSHEREVSEKNSQLEREIAERKQAEDALRDSEDRYRTLVETSPDVIFTLSMQEGIIRSLNPAFESVTGWTRPEWINRHFIEIVHPDDRPLALKKYREATDGAGVMRYDVRCLTRNGSYRIVELTTAPLLQHGVVSGRLGIARDITERTALEEQLRQAAKMQAVGQLAGGIAHDFNNILSIIIGGCDVVLMDMQESDPGRSTIQMVLNAAERGAQVTRNLLTFSRKQVVRTQVRDLNEIILSAEPLIAQLIREDIRFSVDLYEGQAAVHGGRHADRTGADEPGGECEGCHDGAGDASRSAPAASPWTKPSYGRAGSDARENTPFSGWRIPAAGWMKQRGSGSSSPFSRPRGWAKEPASGSPAFSGS